MDLDQNKTVRKLRVLLAGMFAIDLRSLAVFRIGLAGTLIVDLCMRSTFLVENYTDAGVLPVEAVTPSLYSVHLLSGSVAFQKAVFLFAGCVAISLLLGFRTRTATIVSWFLLRSLHIRNPGLLNSGDALLGLLVFWAMFLPLGERFALDATRRRSTNASTDSSYCSAATAAILLQCVFLYMFTGLQKSGPGWRTLGTAIELALRQEYWTRPLGYVLMKYSEPLQVMTVLVRYFEVIGPLILLSAFRYPRIRLMLIVAFLMLQIGISSCLDVHLFGGVSILATIPFLPPNVWQSDAFQRLVRGRVIDEPACSISVPVTARFGHLRQLAIAVLVMAVFLLNLHHLGVVKLPAGFLSASRHAGIFQNWRMYAPSAPDRSFAIEIDGVLPDGSVQTFVKIPGGGEWHEMQPIHSDFRFKYLLGDIAIRFNDGNDEPRFSYYFDWLNRQWHRENGYPLQEIRFYVITRRSLQEQAEPPQKFILQVYQPWRGR